MPDIYYGMVEYWLQSDPSRRIIGYGIAVYKNNTEIDHYTAGNSQYDSQVYVDPNDPHALDRKTLLKYARQTAVDMAIEHGLTKKHVVKA